MFCSSNKPIKKNERYYQNIFCKKLYGITEYRLKDRSRVDCLTKTHAIEVDFGKKVFEGIGQSQHYAYKTNKLPGLALIIRTKTDQRYYDKLKETIKHLNITLYIIKD